MVSFPTPEGISTYHTTAYPSIDVSRPELSTAGKVVLITGGGTGLGLAFAQHFAAAGSTSIAITGRREQVLLDAQKLIQEKYPKTKVLPLPSDVTDHSSIATAFQETTSTFGAKIDILVNNAAFLADWNTIGSDTEDPNQWWNTFSINVRGSHNVLTAFLPVAAPDATVINISSGIIGGVVPGASAYTSSKLAAARVFEFFQAENPGFRVVNLAPGVIMTDMHQKSVQHFDEKGWEQFPLDDSMYWPYLCLMCVQFANWYSRAPGFVCCVGV
jgi:NAD(P)-dependent dehydrogenase (short-subunit alcohol dehydrogenase family)